MMVQLNPPLPLRHEDGRKCLALLAYDYGSEWETIFLVGYTESRELWWVPHTKLRLDDNITFGRPPK